MKKGIHVDPELEIALRVFNHFFDVIGQPLSILNKDEVHIYYNRENALLDEDCQENVVGKKMSEVFSGIKRNENEMLRALEKGEDNVDHHKSYYNSMGKLINYCHTTVPLFNSKRDIIGVIETGHDQSNLRELNEQVTKLNEQLYEKKSPHQDIIYGSSQMHETLQKADLLAKSDVPIMIIGESGTGKELLAQRVYKQSKRKNKPFIALNCAALPGTLIESTLFGSVKGAFTGAENRKGYLELAHGGTLFLDELNSLPLDIQSKLLRFLQEKTFWKLGGTVEQRSDIRIVCAMNESPHEMVADGRLREDLYYRLEVGVVSIPPLRQRKKDIILLANYFVKKHRKTLDRNITHVSANLEESLTAYSWKGNVRMLENVIVRSMLMQESDGELISLVFNNENLDSHNKVEKSFDTLAKINPAHSFVTEKLTPDISITQRVDQYERALIVDALKQYRGSVMATAKALGIARGTLQYKIKKYCIELTVVEKYSN